MVLFRGWELGERVQAWVVECEEWPALFFFFLPLFFPETKTKVLSYSLARRNLEAGGQTEGDRGSRVRGEPPPDRVCRALNPLTLPTWFRGA